MKPTAKGFLFTPGHLLLFLFLFSGLSGAANSKAFSPHPLEPIGKFTVQVAAFDDEQRAKEFTSNLKAHGYKAFYYPVTLKNKPWFRVGVGLFATRSEAVNFDAKLTSNGEFSEKIIRQIDEDKKPKGLSGTKTRME